MEPIRRHQSMPSGSLPPLFLQAAGPTVLIGYRDGERWVLSRGWRSDDCLTDIRCWRFVSAEQFGAQVGRLVRDQDAEHAAQAAATAAGQWVSEAAPR